MYGKDMFSLRNKTALVTGGGSGIGKAIAHALSDAGATIVLIGRRRTLLSQALGQRLGAVLPVDLTTHNAAEEIAQFCATEKLPPDILINAAGTNPRIAAAEVTPEIWQETLQLNLAAPFFLAQHLVPHMRSKKWGRIINIASLQSNRAFANGIAYGASKGGIAQLTRAMAESWSRDGINVNAIAPGFFPTELTAPIFDDAKQAARQAGKTAIGRNGTMQDLAGPVVFLASNASQYVTGQILFVDGGYTAK